MKIYNSFLPYVNGKLPPASMAVAWSHNDGLLSALKSVATGYTSMIIGKITIATLTRPLIIGRTKEYLIVSFATTNPVIAGNMITISI